jgi:hypothetical protein
MSGQTEYQYDVFISYSHKDEDWTDKVLRRRLDDAGLRVCIDYRDFKAGKMALLNMQDAVKKSQHVVLVLTRNWLESEWSLFEALIGGTKDPAGLQQRIIPLLCADGIEEDLNDFIGMRTWVDFARKDREEIAWKQLFNALGKPETTIPPPTPTPPKNRWFTVSAILMSVVILGAIVAALTAIFPSVSDTPQQTFAPNIPVLSPSASEAPQTSAPIQISAETPTPLVPQSTLEPLEITSPKEGDSVPLQIDVYGSVSQSALGTGTHLYIIVIPLSNGPPVYYLQELPTIQADGTWRSSPVKIGISGPASSGKIFQICAVLHSQQLRTREISSFPEGPRSCIHVTRK